MADLLNEDPAPDKSPEQKFDDFESLARKLVLAPKPPHEKPDKSAPETAR